MLKWDNVGKRLEQIGEARRPHATQRKHRSTQRAFDVTEILQQCRIQIEPEHLAQGLSSFDAPRTTRVVASHAETDIWIIDRAAVVDFNERETARQGQYPKVAPLLPQVDWV